MAQQKPGSVIDDPREEELARLRIENAELKKNASHVRLDATEGPKQLYRVKLQSIQRRDGTIVYLPVLKTSFTIGPREVLPGLTPVPDKYRTMQAETYSALDLLLEFKSKDFGGLVWKKYAAKHKLNDSERPVFKIKVVNNGKEDFLDVPAVSQADAFELYRLYQGITATNQQPEVMPVTQAA